MFPMINVDRNKKDEYYRYKMNKVETIYESKKTVISNIELISKSIYRDANLIIKYLTIALGTTNGSDTKDKKYQLKGVFTDEKLQSLIYDFIDLFVLCQNCKNPETSFLMDDDKLYKKCNSCGSIIPQENHKIVPMIIRDLPKKINEDKNYDKKGVNVLKLIEGENTKEELFNYFEENNKDLTLLFTSYFKPSFIPNFKKIYETTGISVFLYEIEDMLERNGKEEKIKGFLKEFIKQGIDIEEIEEHFDKIRKGKKRSPLIKKNVSYFLDEIE